ncbi:MAG: response regulator transcription factor [Candidatus Symbiothrix sp.]|jgi:DNA-binding response OmpR family regulator|nr:response regulator transcription factor [Candidatus Symbiothrix sp.]
MEQVKLLIIDDEEDIREILKFNLENEGFIIDTASSGEEGLEKLCPEHKLIILDVMLGGMSGFHVAGVIRKQGNHVPIIFLTAREDENDLLTGFSVGADDYIKKPFKIKEVIARVKAITRRSEQSGPKVAEETTIVVGDLTLHLLHKTLEIRGKKVLLTPKEFDILALFIRHPQKLFSREDILHEVWKDETYVLARTVDVHVARLRKKLNHYGAYIKNRTGYGYLFNDHIQINKYDD